MNSSGFLNSFLIVLLILPLSNNCFSQSEFTQTKIFLKAGKFSNDGDTLLRLNIRCEGIFLSLIIPDGKYEVYEAGYTEGSIFSIIYSDSSYITILCGSNAELNLSDSTDKSVFSKKGQIKSHTITYENVKQERLCIFNKAFGLMGVKE